MRVTVGRIGRAHGVRGEVVLSLVTDAPADRFADGAVLQTDPADTGPLTVRRSRWHNGRLLVVFDELGDRTAAEAARGTVLVVTVDEDARPEEPEEYYDHQLVGLQVVSVGGSVTGELRDVVHLPAQDLLVVVDHRGLEHMVPFVAELVPVVDLGAGRVTIDPPPGLFEVNVEGPEAERRPDV
ncbi:MAG TPA: ribosome maturation factor RimM [Jiangellaceae bacterium]|nr:ribosome maturation factor RimM [Jiangellaceae bacterium]